MRKSLQDAETRYPELKKLVLALMVASRKLKHYFHTHAIEVLTNYPLHQVLRKPEASRRLLKWAKELSQFDISYKPCTTINQALVDFIAEFTYVETTKIVGTTKMAEAVEKVDTVESKEALSLETSQKSDKSKKLWKLFVDGSSNEGEAGARMMLVSLEQHKIHCALRFGF